ncbi:MAG: hypothetical protein ACW99U_18890 [Candidatus Thorarchaeota archaeon]|jgi:hypothetical protein
MAKRKFLAHHWIVKEITDKKYFDRIFLNETSRFLIVTGTVDGSTESQIIGGSPIVTVVLTISDDTWITNSDSPSFDSQRQAIIDGLDATNSPLELLGWNNEVRDTMGVAQVVRTSDTVVTITLNTTETADYKTTADEIITVTIPASALTSGIELIAENFVTVAAECDETLAPDTIATQTNLSGAVTDIDEPVDSPDGNWLIFTP